MTKTPKSDETLKAPAPRRRRRWLVTAPATIALGAAAWLGSGFYTVGPTERGVVLRFGRVRHDNVPPGIHYALPWPVDRVHTPRTTDVRRVEVGYTMLGEKFDDARRSDMLTGDENILKVRMAVQYKVRMPPAEYLFRADESHWLVERAVEAALCDMVATLSVDDVLTTAKNDIQTQTLEHAQKLLDRYQAGVILLDGALQDVAPPVPVSDAFMDVSSAQKDGERMVDQARQYARNIQAEAQTQYIREINQAKGQAVRLIKQAQGDTKRFLNLLTEYAKDESLARTRLHVETMERILSRVRMIILPPPKGDGAAKLTLIENP